MHGLCEKCQRFDPAAGQRIARQIAIVLPTLKDSHRLPLKAAKSAS
jgi:hypothetical protein